MPFSTQVFTCWCKMVRVAGATLDVTWGPLAHGYWRTRDRIPGPHCHIYP